MIPILYEHNQHVFTSNGICRLPDIVSGTVTEERNGVYECEFTYPISGRNFSEIQEGRIIYCIHDDTKDPEPFDIYSRSQPLDGLVTFYAHHISYRLSKIIIKPPLEASSCAQVISELDGGSCFMESDSSTDFSFWTDKTVTGNFKVKVPTPVREILGGNEGSILDVYGNGEYEFTGFHVALHTNRGADNNVIISYGKNLTEFKYETDISECYDAVAPYWQGVLYDSETGTETDVIVTLITDQDDGYVMRTGATAPPKEIAPLDLTQYFENQPTTTQLRNKAESILNKSEAWKVKENFEVSFAQLWQSEDYATYASLQRVALCDKVTVVNPKIPGIEVKMEVIKVVYDFLDERYKSMELGSPKRNFADSIGESIEESIGRILESYPTKSFMDLAIEHATQLITGGLGGHVVLKPDANGEPEEILIMDTTDITTAQKIWRWNMGGLGFSSTGYNGPYALAMTNDGQIVADRITTGTLNANIIKTGILTDRTGVNYWNLDSGELHISATTDVGVTNLLLDSMEMPTAGDTAWRVTPTNYSTIVLDQNTGFAYADLLKSPSSIYTRVFGRTNKQIKTYMGQYITVSFDIENLFDPEITYIEGEEPSVCAFLNLRTNASDTGSFGEQMWKIDVDSSGIEGDEKKRLHATFGPITAESFTPFSSGATPFNENMYFGIVIGVDRADHTLVSKIKAERGTVATDWSQAPEDIAGLEQQYSILSTTVDEISMEVGSFKSIGGTNLIRETREMPMATTSTNPVKWSMSTGTRTVPLNSEDFATVQFSANSYILRGPTRREVGDYLGQYITFSFDVLAANAAAIQDIRAYIVLVTGINNVSPAELYKMITIPSSSLIAGKTVRVSVTFGPLSTTYFTANSGYSYADNKHIVFSIQDGNTSNAGALTFSKLKAEIGTVSTDWSPAPEDYGAEFDTVDAQWSNLTVTVDGINTEVGKKVGKTEVISSINQSAEQVKIDANKITFAGKTVNFRTTDILLTSYSAGDAGTNYFGDDADILIVPEINGRPVRPIRIGGDAGYLRFGCTNTQSLVEIFVGNDNNGADEIILGNYNIGSGTNRLLRVSASQRLELLCGSTGIAITSSGINFYKNGSVIETW